MILSDPPGLLVGLCIGRHFLVWLIVFHCVGQSKGPSHQYKLPGTKDLPSGVKDLGLLIPSLILFFLMLAEGIKREEVESKFQELSY